MRLPEGFALRAPRWEELDAVLALIRECEEVDDGEAESTADDLRSDWRMPSVDLARDSWIAATPDGGLAVYASVWRRVEGLRFESEGYTHPDYRGRGIGTALVRAVEQRAREQAHGGAKLRATVNHANEPARRLLENEGYTPARFYRRMVIDLDSPPANAGWPEGVSLRGFDESRDERVVHELVQEAFSDNYDYSPLSINAWRAAMLEREDFDPALVFLADQGNEIIGAALCYRYEEQGWVRQLVVRRDWRRRGVALGLLRAAFAEFYRRGERRVGLVVDSFNRTGAKELYERAGKHVERQHDGYEKEL